VRLFVKGFVVRILALDLGLTTGFCWGDSKNLKSMLSGTWSLAPKKHESPAMRLIKFVARLEDARSAMGVDVVYYESVYRHAGTDAAHSYGALMYRLQEWCLRHELPFEGIGVGEIKKFATGKGNASKDLMVAAAVGLGFSPKDDNEADAICLWHLAQDRGL